MKLVKELNESNHVLEVPIFKQFHKFVIGKGGVNIRKVCMRFFFTNCIYYDFNFIYYDLCDTD